MEQRLKKLLDQACTELCPSARDAARLKHYSIRTEESYVACTTRFILFHNKRHLSEMGRAEIEAFLTYLAVEQNRGPFSSRQSSQLDRLEHLRYHGDQATRAERPACHTTQPTLPQVILAMVDKSQHVPVCLPMSRRWPNLREGKKQLTEQNN